MKNNADKERHRADSERRKKCIWEKLLEMQEVLLRHSEERRHKEVQEGI